MGETMIAHQPLLACWRSRDPMPALAIFIRGSEIASLSLSLSLLAALVNGRTLTCVGNDDVAFSW